MCLSEALLRMGTARLAPMHSAAGASGMLLLTARWGRKNTGGGLRHARRACFNLLGPCLRVHCYISQLCACT